MSTPLGKFFSAFATRAYQENAGSDVLYAALSSAEELYRIFAGKLGLPHVPRAEIVREYAHGACRPDFFLRPDSGTAVLLEVKLFDTNYHYREYGQLRIDGAQPRLALRSAHPPVERLSGWTILQWKAIIQEMEQTTDAFILALARYFREVTMMERLEPIAFGRPKAMLYLHRALKHTIVSYRSSRATCALYNGRKPFGETFSGYDYSLTNVSRPRRVVYIWFGLTYSERALCQLACGGHWHFLGNGPHEPHQRTGNRHDHLVGVFAACDSASRACAPPHLSRPTEVLAGFGWVFEPALQVAPDVRGIALGPGAFDQGAPRRGLAGSGERPLLAPLATGVFRGDQPQARHELSGGIEAGQVPSSAPVVTATMH